MSARLGWHKASIRAPGYARAMARMAGVASRVSPIRETLMTRKDRASAKILPPEDMVAAFHVNQVETRFFDACHDSLRFCQGVVRGPMVELDEQLTDLAEQAARAQIVENLVFGAFDIELEHVALASARSRQHLVERSRGDLQPWPAFNVSMTAP